MTLVDFRHFGLSYLESSMIIDFEVSTVGDGDDCRSRHLELNSKNKSGLMSVSFLYSRMCLNRDRLIFRVPGLQLLEF